MGTRNQLKFESLESRHLLSGGALLSHFLASQAAVSPAAPGSSSPAEHGSSLPAVSPTLLPAVQPDAAQAVSAPTVSLRQYIPSLSSDAVTARWDWLAQTVWYVPTENILA